MEAVLYQEFVPDPRLQHLVRAYWQVEELYTGDHREHRAIPERAVRLTFSTGESWQGSLLAGALERQPQARLSGLNLRPLSLVSHGWARALGADLYPWGARQLFGWTLALPNLDLAVRYAAPVRDIGGLLQCGDLVGARQALEGWLLTLWAERAREPGKGVEAAGQLYRSYGSARIATLAGELNLSPRQLERRFREEVGLNAKTLARLIRFGEVQYRLYRNPGLSLAPLAYELGFADQAHLTREFRTLAQLTPKAFARLSVRRRE